MGFKLRPRTGVLWDRTSEAWLELAFLLRASKGYTNIGDSAEVEGGAEARYPPAAETLRTGPHQPCQAWLSGFLVETASARVYFSDSWQKEQAKLRFPKRHHAPYSPSDGCTGHDGHFLGEVQVQQKPPEACKHALPAGCRRPASERSRVGSVPGMGSPACNHALQCAACRVQTSPDGFGWARGFQALQLLT